MFTGIVTAIGTISSVEKRSDTRITVTSPFDPAVIDIGASIACSGVCLTVVELAGEAGDARIGFDISDETIRRTVKGMWAEGRKLNLEPALRIGDELGGHLVTGHVDTVGEVVAVKNTGGSTILTIRISNEFAPFVAEKGSITIDGVSLTVNNVCDHIDGACDFTLNIIPHTADVTTLGMLSTGDTLNIEIDILARYLKRMQNLSSA